MSRYIDKDLLSEKEVDVVKTKLGKWNVGHSWCMYFCSQCSYPAYPRESDEWAYCPNCGAKMTKRKKNLPIIEE